ncbi:hypothetical protein FUAX_28340 [Fulvitalea axinellae]|uniref:Phosphoribosylaminoimidazolesuccinocarboxamide synthase n=1 Tax=Fulvitalea axinellae TaxID=1182444 RepID=A0AAU9CY49_9BACT|nr:hypothetical protein FUAX_28340 [Fulvitalea axinellae]
MKKDIEIKEMKGVRVAIVRSENEKGEQVWDAYLINLNSYKLENVIVASRGYDLIDGKEVNTSVLRHMFKEVDPDCAIKIEPVSPEVFGITNEYWVSFFGPDGLIDRKFLFPGGLVAEEHLSIIPELEKEGVYAF